MTQNQLTLALNVATREGGIGVFGPGERVMLSTQPEGYRWGNYLVNDVQQLLHNAELRLCDLALIAVTVGPGLFTGVRLGLAAAHGWQLITGVQVVGIMTTEVWFHQHRSVAIAQKISKMLVVVDGKRADVYAQWFDVETGLSLTQPESVIPQDLQRRWPQASEVMVVGDGVPLVRSVVTKLGAKIIELQELDLPSLVACARYHAGQKISSLAPVYVRPADVTLPEGREIIHPLNIM
jgi:tRNA threonylcarbamoyladenosine biosynthesis protein TsaB